MSAETTGLPAMLATEQAAAALHCAEWTIQRKCRQSQIPGAIKIFNDHWLIPEATVASLLSGVCDE